MAHDAAEVRDLAAGAPTLHELVARQSVCRACPRLVDWREEVARVRRRAFATERYWGRPISGWGDNEPQIVILGLAPARRQAGVRCVLARLVRRTGIKIQCGGALSANTAVFAPG